VYSRSGKVNRTNGEVYGVCNRGGCDRLVNRTNEGEVYGNGRVNGPEGWTIRSDGGVYGSYRCGRAKDRHWARRQTRGQDSLGAARTSGRSCGNVRLLGHGNSPCHREEVMNGCRCLRYPAWHCSGYRPLVVRVSRRSVLDKAILWASCRCAAFLIFHGAHNRSRPQQLPTRHVTAVP
jgi:hypothetical protein